MGSSNRILSIDIGAGTIRMAEFEYSSAGMTLHTFDWRSLDGATESELDRAMQISAAIKDMYTSNKFTVKNANVCASGQSAFVRFVKLPPVSGGEAQVKKVVQFEAQQNVPFSLDEVSWDYQLLSSGEEGDELEVMLVVIKNEIITEITGAVARAGLQSKLVDISSASLLNAAKANNIGTEECVMLLDIGERCSDLLFIDGNRFFSRTIPIAGHTITQQIAKEFKIGLEEAEDLKRRHGFVALGAGYEDPKSEVAAVISKIVRNVMTRLHSEINRSKSVYCTQQKGEKPAKLYLTGGSSMMMYTDVFFSEKLGLETLYFNPFEAIKLSPRIQPEKLQPVAHTFGALIGTALRNLSQSPIEISLMTDEVREALEIAPKKKFLYAGMLALIVTFILMLIGKQRQLEQLEKVENRNSGILGNKVSLAETLEEELEIYKKLNERQMVLAGLVNDKPAWINYVNKVQELVPDNVTVSGITPVYTGKVVEEESGGNARNSRYQSKRNKSDDEDSEDEGPKVEPTHTSFNGAKRLVALRISGYVMAMSGEQGFPSEQFLNNLKNDGMFVSDSLKTLYSQAPRAINEFRNVKSFEIEATLTEPLSLIKE